MYGHKFKIGDVVEVVAVDGDTLPIGTLATIIEYDNTFGVNPYILDKDEENYYNDSMLKLVPRSDTVQENESSDEVLKFVVTHFVDSHGMKLKDGNDKLLIWDTNQSTDAQNMYLSGFFSGLSHLNIRYEVKVEYVRG